MSLRSLKRKIAFGAINLAMCVCQLIGKQTPLRYVCSSFDNTPIMTRTRVTTGKNGVTPRSTGWLYVLIIRAALVLPVVVAELASRILFAFKFFMVWTIHEMVTLTIDLLQN